MRVVDPIHALQPPKRGAEFAGNLNQSIAWTDPVLCGSLRSLGDEKKLSRIDAVRIREVVGKLKRGDGTAHSVRYDKEECRHPAPGNPSRRCRPPETGWWRQELLQELPQSLLPDLEEDESRVRPAESSIFARHLP